MTKFIDESFGIIPYTKKENKILFLIVKASKGHWSFPKGHKENNESNLDCAKRELFEETGISNIDIKKETLTVNYSFCSADGTVFKTVNYFLGELKEDFLNIPEKFRKEIVEASFFDIEETEKKINFKDYNDLFEKLKEIVKDL